MLPFTNPLETHLSDTARSVRLALPKPQESRASLRRTDFLARQDRAAAALANMAKFPAGGRGPKSGTLGRCQAAPGGPLHPPGRRGRVGGCGCVCVSRRGGARAAVPAGRPAGGKQGPAAGLSGPRRSPRTTAAAPPPGAQLRQGLAATGRGSARLPPQACRRPPAPLCRWSGPPHLQAGGGRAAPSTAKQQNRRLQVRRSCPGAKPRIRGVRRRGAAGGGAAWVPSRPVPSLSAAGGAGPGSPRGPGRGAPRCSPRHWAPRRRWLLRPSGAAPHLPSWSAEGSEPRLRGAGCSRTSGPRGRGRSTGKRRGNREMAQLLSAAKGRRAERVSSLSFSVGSRPGNDHRK